MGSLKGCIRKVRAGGFTLTDADVGAIETLREEYKEDGVTSDLATRAVDTHIIDLQDELQGYLDQDSHPGRNGQRHPCRGGSGIVFLGPKGSL